MIDLKQSSILILDFGSQYTQLIARRLREMGVYCVLYPYSITRKQFDNLNPCGVILSGGPATVTRNPLAPEWLFHVAVPLLGICYGMQAMALHMGGEVKASSFREFGHAKLNFKTECDLFKSIEGKNNIAGEAVLDVWMSHGDTVTQLPPGFEIMCATTNAPIAGIVHKDKKFFGLQFHPEVTHTPEGLNILRRFVVDICKAHTTWNTANIIDDSLTKIKKQVGEDKVLLALSGGVDSSVVAALLHKAIDAQLICVFVDTGLLRLNEAAQVEHMFSEHLGVRLITVYAEARFLNALHKITCPEEKRKIIGKTFIDVFEEEAKKN